MCLTLIEEWMGGGRLVEAMWVALSNCEIKEAGTEMNGHLCLQSRLRDSMGFITYCLCKLKTRKPNNEKNEHLFSLPLKNADMGLSLSESPMLTLSFFCIQGNTVAIPWLKTAGRSEWVLTKSSRGFKTQAFGLLRKLRLNQTQWVQSSGT